MECLFPRQKSFYIKQVRLELEELLTKGMRTLYATLLGRPSAHISQTRTSYNHITVLYTEMKAYIIKEMCLNEM